MNIWDILTAGMPQRYVAPDDCDFWFDGNEILCRTEIQATALFVMLDRLLPQTLSVNIFRTMMTLSVQGGTMYLHREE